MKKLMNVLFLSCLKASELIEKSLQFRLTLREKMQLSMHKKMCDACKLYEKQSKFLDAGIKKALDSTEPSNEAWFIPESPSDLIFYVDLVLTKDLFCQVSCFFLPINQNLVIHKFK